ncbi:MAG: SdiA-regulated domain-containing protein [Myxococcota bacterium]
MARGVRVLLALLLCSCGGEERPRGEDQPPVVTSEDAGVRVPSAPYDLDTPTEAFALSEELREISGVTVLPDGRLAVVQDEVGMLFVLNPETAFIEERHYFEDGADYEGVELAGGRMFVLRNTGTLLELENWQGLDITIRHHATPLTRENDTEGITYDATTNRILMACKEYGGPLVGERERAVYAYDLGAEIYLADPAYRFNMDAMPAELREVADFKPSAIALHPITGELYVLSSTARGLVALGTDGSIRHSWRLKGNRFEQPEGLAFSPDGTMWMTSEGVEGPGRVFRFDPLTSTP